MAQENCAERAGRGTIDKSWRFMYFEKGDWVKYSEEANAAVWKSFRAGRSTAELTVQKRVYTLNFPQMVQVNKETGYVRSLAWIDDAGEMKRPANPIAGPAGSGAKSGALGFGIRVNQHGGTWRDGATDSISSILLGSDVGRGCELGQWAAAGNPVSGSGDTGCDSIDASGDDEFTKLTLGHVSFNFQPDPADSKPAVADVEDKPPKFVNTTTFSSQRLVGLEAGDKDFEDVKRIFLSGIGNFASGTTITGIHCDSSPAAVARREAFERQRELKEKVRGNANVRYGWHGTSKKGVEGIFLHGFGQPKTTKNGSAYGVGVYLAVENQSFVSAIYADNDENGEQHVVLCQVIAGNSELVKHGSEQFHPSSEHFDTGVDDTISPKRLIVWSTHMNTHILPLYVVSFKLPSRWHQMMATLNSKKKGSSTFCHPALEKRSFPINQTCGMAENLRNKEYGCMNRRQRPTSAFISFRDLFALLQLLLTPEQCLALKNCHVKYEAGEMPRGMLIQEIQKMVGRDCLIHAIQMCQGFQEGQSALDVKAH
jgi:hypothetical protein